MSDGIDLKISNLVAFNKALNKKLQDNKVKEYVTRATLMVQNTAKQSIMAGGTGKDHIKSISLEELIEHQHLITHLLQIQVI
jgi:hypothetical protein